MSNVLIVFLNGLAFSCILFLLASGLTLILGLARIVNFAHGSLYVLGGYLFVSLVSFTGNWWFALIVAPLLVAVIGGIIEYFLLRPIYKKEELLQLILTFGLVLIIEDLIKMVWGNVIYSTNIAPAILSGSIKIWNNNFPINSIGTIITAVGVLILLGLLLTRTRLGKRINAASSDMQMAEALGMNVPKLFTSVFVIGSLCAGIGGCLITLRVGLLPTLGLEYLIYAFAVVVIGGLGSFKGSVYGALIVGVSYSFGILLIPDFAMVFIFALLLLTLLVKPRGLFGDMDFSKFSSGSIPKRVEIDFMKLTRGKLSEKRISVIFILGLLALVILLPYFASAFWVLFATEAIILILLAMSLNLLLTAGMLSLAHGAFFGSGAYAASLILLHFTNSMFLSFFLSIVVAALIAFIIGLLSLRHVEIYFALLTLAFAQFVYTILFKWKKVTGGDDGLMGIPLPSINFFGLSGDLFTPNTEAKYLYFVLIIAIICFLFLRTVKRSPFGQMLHAIRENPERVAFLGVNPNLYKLGAFVIAGSVAGLAGALFAPFQMVISPIAAHWTKAVDPLFMNIIGGVNSIFGPTIGAIIYLFFKDWLSSMMEYWRISFGIILLLAALFFPRGLIDYAKISLAKSAFVKRRQFTQE